jgi:hypothetical protein
MPATTLPTDEQIRAAFRTLGRAIAQTPSTAASKAASGPALSRSCAAANAPSNIASTRSAFPARHAAIVARLFIPKQDAVAVEDIQGSLEVGEMQRIRRLIISSLLCVDWSWYSK